MFRNLSSITYVKPVRMRIVKRGVSISCQDPIFCIIGLSSKTSWKNVDVWFWLTVLSAIMSSFSLRYQHFLLLSYLFLRTRLLGTIDKESSFDWDWDELIIPLPPEISSFLLFKHTYFIRDWLRATAITRKLFSGSFWRLLKFNF